MTRIRLIGKRRGRCAYCKDTLDATAIRCEGCNTECHEDCLEELGRCPTLGCEGRPGGVEGGVAGDLSTNAERRVRRARHREFLANMDERVLQRLAERERRPALESARHSIYNRLLHSAFWHGVLLLLAIGLVVLAIANPEATWAFLKRGKNGRIHSDGGAVGIGLLMGGFGFGVVWYLIWWLKQVPRVRREVERLLDETQPVPMRLRMIKRGSGKNEQTLAELTGEGFNLEYKVGGLLTPSWFSLDRAPEQVLVYGADDPETPVVVELLDGGLVLVEP